MSAKCRGTPQIINLCKRQAPHVGTKCQISKFCRNFSTKSKCGHLLHSPFSAGTFFSWELHSQKFLRTAWSLHSSRINIKEKERAAKSWFISTSKHCNPTLKTGAKLKKLLAGWPILICQQTLPLKFALIFSLVFPTYFSPLAIQAQYIHNLLADDEARWHSYNIME